MQKYNKAFAAALAAMLTQLIVAGLAASGYVIDPEVNVAITTLATAFFVWLIPNVQNIDDIILELAKQRGYIAAKPSTRQKLEVIKAVDDIMDGGQ